MFNNISETQPRLPDEMREENNPFGFKPTKRKIFFAKEPPTCKSMKITSKAQLSMLSQSQPIFSTSSFGQASTSAAIPLPKIQIHPSQVTILSQSIPRSSLVTQSLKQALDQDTQTRTCQAAKSILPQKHLSPVFVSSLQKPTQLNSTSSSHPKIPIRCSFLPSSLPNLIQPSETQKNVQPLTPIRSPATEFQPSSFVCAPSQSQASQNTCLLQTPTRQNAVNPPQAFHPLQNLQRVVSRGLYNVESHCIKIEKGIDALLAEKENKKQLRRFLEKPFKNSTEFKKFEGLLVGDESLQEKLREHFQSLLSSDSKCVGNIWQGLLNDEAASAFVWKGRKDVPKEAVRQYKLSQIFKECFNAKFCVFNDEFDALSRKFFNYAHDRQRKREFRIQIRAATPEQFLEC